MASGSPTKGVLPFVGPRFALRLCGGPFWCSLRASHCHATLWACGRVNNSADFTAKQKSLATSWFAGVRYVVISPARLSSALRIVTLRFGPMAGSLSLRLGQKPVPHTGLGFLPSLRSKLPYGPKLRASLPLSGDTPRVLIIHFPLGGQAPPHFGKEIDSHEADDRDR